MSERRIEIKNKENKERAEIEKKSQMNKPI